MRHERAARLFPAQGIGRGDPAQVDEAEAERERDPCPRGQAQGGRVGRRGGLATRLYTCGEGSTPPRFGQRLPRFLA